MSVTGTVRFVALSSWGDDSDPAWRVTADVPNSGWAPRGALAFYIGHAEPCPLKSGDSVTIPVTCADGTIHRHAAGSDLHIRMLGSVMDPDARLL